MKTDNRPDVVTARNRYLTKHEQLTMTLWQLNALLTVAVTTQGFYALPETVLHHYFLIAVDLVDKTEQATQLGVEE